MAEYKIENVKLLLDRLKGLGDDVSKKVAWKALRTGAAVIQKNAIQNAKKIDAASRPGIEDSQIFKFIKIQKGTKLAKSGYRIAYRVGVQGGAVAKKGQGRTPPTYWRHVEFGTKNTKAQPFLRPAGEADHNLILQKIEKRFWKEILKAEALK